jgi:hypothetical protein
MQHLAQQEWRQGEAYLDEVDFGETFIVSGLLDVKNGNNVLMVEVSQQLHLS